MKKGLSLYLAGALLLLAGVSTLDLEHAPLSKKVTNSIPYMLAKDDDKALTQYLMPYQLELAKIDSQRNGLSTSKSGERELNQEELELVEDALHNYGLHSDDPYKPIFSNDELKRNKKLNTFPQAFKIIADIYFRAGHLRLTTDVLAGDQGIYSQYFKSVKERGESGGHSQSSLPGKMTTHEEAFFHIFTAATLNHKRARFTLAIILENGLIPCREVIVEATKEGAKFNYLRSLVDVEQSVLFKYLEEPANDSEAYQMLAQFETDTKAQAMSNLYISSQVTSNKMMFEYMQSETFEKDTSGNVGFTKFNSDQHSLQKLDFLEATNREMQRQAAPAQMSLGNRYQFGITLDEDCDSSTLYYEAAARQTIGFIERTHGLLGPERRKLSLMGPFAIEESLLLSNVISLEHLYTSTDVVELLDQQGQYGSTESLNFLGFSALMGKGKMERNFERAHELFTKSLKIDKKDSTANYCLGLMNALGLIPGQKADADAAVKHYTRAGDDARAYNALGVIYYVSPDPFESDPSKLHGFKSIRRDRKKAMHFLKLAAEKNNVQAQYSLGAIHLDETNHETFSFSKAYDYFKTAASLGHTLAAYNIGVMHFTGLGTFKSCNVANAFLKHVVTMGEDSIEMQRAYHLVEQGNYVEATWKYMELAEMGQGVAALNAALLLEKFNIFDSQRTLLGQITTKVFLNKRNHSVQAAVDNFDINKQLAFRLFQISLYQKETEDEASLKIADFMYYGTAGQQDFAQALQIYKVTQEQTMSAEIRGHALLKLGMIYQFGYDQVVDIDHDLAQLYYEKALKEHSTVQVPVYMMSLYSKWQRLDLGATFDDFLVEFIEEPWSRGSILIISLCLYGIILAGTVSMLRDEKTKEEGSSVQQAT